MKTLLKSFLFLIIAGVLLTPFFAMPNTALADGMIIKPDPYYYRWDYLGESNQQAFINYEDGLEKMILSIGMEETSESAVWIFPVPSEPNKVVVDVVVKLPQLRGEEITKKAKSNLSDIKKSLPVTQIYTIPFIINWWGAPYIGDTEGFVVPRRSGIGGKERETDVIVHEHLEKEGITTEIITAKTAQALYQYLQKRGLTVKQGSIPILDHYIGKEFTFVVSWISEKVSSPLSQSEIEQNLLYYLKNYNDYPKVSNYFDMQVGIHFPDSYLRVSGEEAYRYLQDNPELKEKFANHLFQNQSLITPHSQQNKEKQKGVFVTFPTTKIYYPLLPTSVYGSEVVPTTIRIVGHTSPDIFKNIKSYTNTEYYIDEEIALEDELKNFYSGPTKNIKYTKIKINAPSKFLTDDLWINPRAPLKTFYSSFVGQHALISGILLLILSSITTGIIAGWIAFKDLRNKNGLVKLGLIGLSNCLSVIGILITTFLTRTKQKNENIIPLLSEIKQRGYFWKRRLAAILFSLLLLIFVFVIPSLIVELVDVVSGRSYFIISIEWFILVAVLVFFLVIKRIKPEDKNLFEQLKLNNYSSWSFHPKDKMKYAFVPVFSVAFLIISWLVVKLVELTV